MATYNTAYGTLPSNQDQIGLNNTTAGGANAQPKTNAMWGGTTSSSAAQQPPQNFAQMQKVGQARPAPPMAGAMDPSQRMQQQLQRSLAQGLAQPSAYTTDAFQQMRAAQASNLQAEYTGQQKSLDEELARRGLSASSIGGGRMGDLAGQQARALSSLDAQLLQQFATTQAADRLAAQQAAQGNIAQQQQNALSAGQLTGQYGGQQTLAGQQQAEQSRQFDIQQQLAQTLGLGNLGISQQEVGIKQQSLQQQAADAAAERTLRESMQTRELTAAEKQQLTDITSRKDLQSQQIGAQQAESAAERDIRLRLQSGQITAEQAQQERQIAAAASLQTQQLMQQATQFGLTLDENKANRLQQYGISAEELALKSRQITQEGALQNRQIGVQEAQNLAQNGLELQKISQQASQFGMTLTESQASRIQAGGFTAQELAMESQKINNQNKQFERQQTAQETQDLAINNLETAKLSQQNAQFNTTMQQSLAEFFTQQTGNMYKVVNGAIIPTGGTSLAGQSMSFEQASARAKELAAQTGKQYSVDRDNATGMYTVSGAGGDTQAAKALSAEQEMARNQMFMQLSSVLSGLTPEQFSKLTAGAYAAPGEPNDGALDASGAWRWSQSQRKWVSSADFPTNSLTPISATKPTPSPPPNPTNPTNPTNPVRGYGPDGVTLMENLTVGMTTLLNGQPYRYIGGNNWVPA